MLLTQVRHRSVSSMAVKITKDHSERITVFIPPSQEAVKPSTSPVEESTCGEQQEVYEPVYNDTDKPEESICNPGKNNAKGDDGKKGDKDACITKSPEDVKNLAMSANSAGKMRRPQKTVITQIVAHKRKAVVSGMNGTNLFVMVTIATVTREVQMPRNDPKMFPAADEGDIAKEFAKQRKPGVER